MNQATLTGRPILYILWIGRKLNILIPNSRYKVLSPQQPSAHNIFYKLTVGLVKTQNPRGCHSHT